MSILFFSPFDSYQDKCDNYIDNEVALDYNAGFQSTVAALVP